MEAHLDVLVTVPSGQTRNFLRREDHLRRGGGRRAALEHPVEEVATLSWSQSSIHERIRTKRRGRTFAKVWVDETEKTEAESLHMMVCLGVG